jgi:hypothetical protein
MQGHPLCFDVLLILILIICLTLLSTVTVTSLKNFGSLVHLSVNSNLLEAITNRLDKKVLQEIIESILIY